MSSQAITDYLTKQIFIEKNVITFRALSRHLSIHVNAAKNELATYHHNAPYQSQPCTAIFMLTGVMREKESSPTQDLDMDGYPTPTQEEEDEEDDGEWTPRITVTLVNERDLEGAKDSYEELHSVSIYSLAPTSLHDASLLCTSIAQVRETDRAKGQAYSSTVGRITTKGIKPGGSKKKAQPAAPVAGPSKLKAPADTKSTAKPEVKEPEKAAATDKGKEKEKEKPKQSGKLNFFAKPAESKNVKKEKEDTSAADSKKKLFFGKPTAKKDTAAPAAPVEVKAEPPKAAPAPPAADKKKAEEPKKESTLKVEEKIPSTRGVKRKSSVGLESRERTPEKPAGSSKATDTAGVKVKRRVVLSDDESDGGSAPAKPTARKSRAAARVVDSDAERDAMALMDIDDDEVERVSRVPSTTVSSRGSVRGADDDDDDDVQIQESKPPSPAAQDDDEDVDMEDLDAPVKAKPKPRKPKTVVPVGRNGLKKRKVMKTRRTVGEDGYTRKEDYSDWESVDEGDVEPEEAPAPAKATKAKAKAAVKKEVSDDDEEEGAAKKKTEKPKATAAPAKKAAAKAPAAAKPKAAPKAAGSAKGKPQQQKLNFFGPKKT